MSKEKESEKHPSYCVARLNRQSGGNMNFYGSAIHPQNFISLEIIPSEKEVSEFGHERFTSYGLPFIEIRMTNHQFAEMITTLNDYSGVPVTLNYRDGVKIESCPLQSNPMDNVIQKADEGVVETQVFIKEYLEKISTLINKPSVGKKDKEEIDNIIAMVGERLEANVSFYRKQVIEVGEGVKANIKTEIDALISNKVYETGLETLMKNRMEQIGESDGKL